MAKLIQVANIVAVKNVGYGESDPYLNPSDKRHEEGNRKTSWANLKLQSGNVVLSSSLEWQPYYFDKTDIN